MRSISIFTIFYKSIYSVKEIAKYRFLGIGKTFQYVFFLAFLYFLPSLSTILFIDKHSTTIPGFDLDTSGLFIMVPIYMLFTYVLNVGVIVAKISIFAVVALLFAKWGKRKLPYRQSWRLTAFSFTFPTLLFGILSLLQINITADYIIDFAICLLYLFFGVRKIPKPKLKK
ncbi:DUF1189 family protein [Bacillus sp. FJAT-50079]|uniref:DUF1189 family protein n=1 Tax=Bacillus sp. FJAT-50079 TaxID=2833577 RepID=UPI001BC8EDFF|nr:DUF1189 family protein [Bacillus sp. FJAT-50079]MBS4209101.1 DUF1189 family protein [Bacillus sp. FJAT-50079]